MPQRRLRGSLFPEHVTRCTDIERRSKASTRVQLCQRRLTPIPGNAAFGLSADLPGKWRWHQAWGRLRAAIRQIAPTEGLAAESPGGPDACDWVGGSGIERRGRLAADLQLVPSTDHVLPGDGAFPLSLDFLENGARANSRVLSRQIQAKPSGGNGCVGTNCRQSWPRLGGGFRA